MKKFDRHVLGERIKLLRNEAGIGQNKLAKDLQVSNASISYWETAKQEPTAEAIFKIAQYFNVSADYLLGLTDF
ncbi:MAG: helix-turn-helix domain-containing protein [Clostridia bacterium]|nr:helix-turn-helix domain-containing protein [Clostridia bacterium]